MAARESRKSVPGTGYFAIIRLYALTEHRPHKGPLDGTAVLQSESAEARRRLEHADPRLADCAWRSLRGPTRRLRIKAFIIPHEANANIQLVLGGIVVYAAIVTIFRSCAVIAFMHDHGGSLLG